MARSYDDLMGGSGEPVAGRIESNGVRTAWLDWGGVGDALVLLHPNGFCAGVYDPLARRLATRHRVLGIDLRGHGDSDDVVDPMLLGNDIMASDALAVLEHLGIDQFAVVGVSSGGAVGGEMAAVAPDRVTALVLCEAVAIDARVREDQLFGFVDGPDGPVHPLAAGARRRRDVWDDRDAVRASYGSRPPLDELHPDALAGYVRWGFRDRPDGRVELSCRPETEAQIFGSTERHGPAESFEALRRVAVDGRVPAAVLVGSTTDLDREWFRCQAEVLGVDLEVVDGGHFFLFEDVDRGVRLIEEHLMALGDLRPGAPDRSDSSAEGETD
ncbi:MAG: alpha/beta hydrolase [Actinomycetota bacterium]|nr:alpha/beta hydrolase [Actinomycetota bacterium]